MAPDRCPDCGTEIEGDRPDRSPQREEEPVIVVQYRLNRLGAAGGIALAGLVTGAASWFIGRQELGVGLFLLALVVAGLLLLKR